MLVALLILVAFLLYLVVERLLINRWRQSIPLLISITGTRGKSSVVLVLASILRASGRRVLAKTTGTRPTLIHPDGTEHLLSRRGPATILEQKKLLRTGAKLEVECIVAEVMSIHSENHFVESQQILQPDLVGVTNVWPDHFDAHGQTEADVATVLSNDFPDDISVFLSTDYRGFFQKELVQGRGITFKELAGTTSPVKTNDAPIDHSITLAANVELASSIASHMGVDPESIKIGLESVVQRLSSSAITRILTHHRDNEIFLINGFAANDPVSTRCLLKSAAERMGDTPSQFAGLLCLRADRADRTVQWIDALREELPIDLEPIFVIGGHAPAFARKVDGARVIKETSPKVILNAIAKQVEDNTAVFGFGNMVGTGQALVDYVETNGKPYGI